MHRTQIPLQEEQYRLFGVEAKRTGISVSDLIRNLVDMHFKGRENIQEDPLESIIGIGAGWNRRSDRQKPQSPTLRGPGLKPILVDTGARFALVDHNDPDHQVVVAQSENIATDCSKPISSWMKH